MKQEWKVKDHEMRKEAGKHPYTFGGSIFVNLCISCIDCTPIAVHERGRTVPSPSSMSVAHSLCATCGADSPSPIDKI